MPLCFSRLCREHDEGSPNAAVHPPRPHLWGFLIVLSEEREGQSGARITGRATYWMFACVFSAVPCVKPLWHTVHTYGLHSPREPTHHMMRWDR